MRNIIAGDLLMSRDPPCGHSSSALLEDLEGSR